MSDVIIQAEELGKKYTLGRQAREGSGYHTLREELMEGARGLFRRNGTRGQVEEFWALRDITFQIRRGEAVGIIGRNGAGKSTLLKILSRITDPTTGKVRIKGRVASLLEVGTGFHPELTGRENIFLNGAILGMTRAEIKSNFDEIVTFAEVEKFLDTPVKRYSSGMYVRLAFAVAAHLDPEILIVDEVLAVGDAQFQKKCLDKMESAGQQGRTVLFVSHNMPAVNRLCSSAILLGDGKVVAKGDPHSITAKYLSSGTASSTGERTWTHSQAPGDHVVRLRRIAVINSRYEVLSAVDTANCFGVSIEFEILSDGPQLVPNFNLINSNGVCVCHPHDWNTEVHPKPRSPGSYQRVAWFPAHLLPPDSFTISVAISSYRPVCVHAVELNAVSFDTLDTSETSAQGEYIGDIPGVIRPMLDWHDAEIPPRPIEPAASLLRKATRDRALLPSSSD